MYGTRVPHNPTTIASFCGFCLAAKSLLTRITYNLLSLEKNKIKIDDTNQLPKCMNYICMFMNVILIQQTFTVPNNCNNCAICFLKVLSYSMYIISFPPEATNFKWTFTFPRRKTQQLNQNETVKQQY